MPGEDLPRLPLPRPRAHDLRRHRRPVLQRGHDHGDRDLGADRLYLGQVEQLRRKSGVDLPGKSPGILRDAKTWYCTDLGTNAIGQGVALCILQMASVYATVANNEVLRSPTLLRGTIDAGRPPEPPASQAGGCCRPAPPGPCRGSSRAWSPRAAPAPRPPSRSGGSPARPAPPASPTPSAAATGRAYVGSFIGFAPAEKPAVVVAVVIDEPTRGYYGGSVAAPVFREVTSTALRRLGVVPTLPAKAER